MTVAKVYDRDLQIRLNRIKDNTPFYDLMVSASFYLNKRNRGIGAAMTYGTYWNEEVCGEERYYSAG